MLMSSTISIPLIPTRKSSPRAIIFTIELTMGQALSPYIYEYWHYCEVSIWAHRCRAHGSTKTWWKNDFVGLPGRWRNGRKNM